MSSEKTIEVTGLDDFEDVEVVEVLVSVGDDINKDQSIITMESDKATMELDSFFDGVLLHIAVKEGPVPVGSKCLGDCLFFQRQLLSVLRGKHQRVALPVLRLVTVSNRDVVCDPQASRMLPTLNRGT